MTVLIFYTTAGCHLCEHAAEMLAYLQTHHEVEVRQVDIAGEEALVEKYGIRIPVVRREQDATELGWPFSYDELLTLL